MPPVVLFPMARVARVRPWSRLGPRGLLWQLLLLALAAAGLTAVW